MVAPLLWPCSSCSIMVSPAMTISLFWNKCPSIATPRYSMSSSGVFLCLDEVCGRGMRLPFGSLKFSHQRVSRVQTPLYYTVTRYIPFDVYFLMASSPDRITPDRRLPEATRSTLHHYFITHSYLLIIDKFLLIECQATVKQPTLILADGS